MIRPRISQEPMPIAAQRMAEARARLYRATHIRTTCEECGRPLGTGDRVDKGMCWSCWGACHD